LLLKQQREERQQRKQNKKQISTLMTRTLRMSCEGSVMSLLEMPEDICYCILVMAVPMRTTMMTVEQLPDDLKLTQTPAL
jgi:phosphosulfolactate phosphohydrolase-like enzyme